MLRAFPYSIVPLFLIVGQSAGQGMLTVELDDLTLMARPEQWELEQDDASRDAVLDTLTDLGWDLEQIEDALSNQDAFELYSRSTTLGTRAYLAVPQNGNTPPIEFSPNHGAPVFFGGPSSEEIRQEIIDGMQAAIDALCGMRAKPDTIRAQASAFGVVEVEATWSAAEVCD